MQRKARILALFICVALVFSVPVCADSGKVILTPSVSGDEVCVTLSTTELCYGIQAVLAYDSEVLTYSSVEFEGAAADINRSESSAAATDEGVRLILVGEQQGAWVTVRFTAVAGASATTVLSLNGLKTVDGTGAAVETAADAVSVTVTPLKGDANGDGEIDIRDLVRIKKYLAAPTSEDIVAANADCDGTDGIDLGDVVALRKQLLGIAELK